ncbi:transposase, IS605 OrfB family, central region [Desulfofundulus thermosubterraneus DSM 16057]|uniref:Transposase, IS605 OrfB family, central region n=2 Tax=Desulfofundulus TaxID=2282741 RepID=A0A1M6IWR1_9FIRM|nr:transposase, IS605 OrfB family, central region [Desulfofundulus thermosubterraneus DSM 16057]
METMPDHLHIFLSAPPTVAPTDIVRKLESITANKIFSAFSGLKSGFWSRSYYIGTAVNVSAETIRKYIEAAIDPGEVHALTITDGDDALVISGRLLRSLNRLRNKVLRQLQRAISKTKEGSRKRRKLLAKKYRFLNWIERRIEHILHTISARAVRWCLKRSVKTVYIGNPEGVRERDCGRHHNQRMGQWAFGKLRDLLAYKLKRHGIELIPVDERGTSGTCPVCGEYTRQTGRVYRCGNASCGFTGIHRDVLGASGILDKALDGSFTRGRRLPGKVEYLRPQVLAPQKAA